MDVVPLCHLRASVLDLSPSQNGGLSRLKKSELYEDFMLSLHIW